MILQFMLGRVIRLPLLLALMALACSAIELDASNYHDKTEGKIVFLKVGRGSRATSVQLCAYLSFSSIFITEQFFAPCELVSSFDPGRKRQI